MENPPNLSKPIEKRFLIPVIGFSVVTLFLVLYFFYPVGNDWTQIFINLSKNFLDPFKVSGFTNPPWAVFFLPHVFLPIKISNTVNMMLNIIVLTFAIKKFESGWLGILLTFTSPFFFDMARVNPIDWIPLLGMLLPPMWGFLLIAAKPQSIGMAAIILWKREKFRLKILFPSLIVLVLSFLIWGWWFLKIRNNLQNMMYNFSFWPFGIPVGLYLLYKAYKTDDEGLAALSTLFFVPYIAPYSFTGLIAVMSKKNRMYAVFLYLAGWWFFIIEARRLLGIV